VENSARDDESYVDVDRALIQLGLRLRPIYADAATRNSGGDLSRQALRVLGALRSGGRQSIASVARTARMDVAAVSRQLQGLEAAGFTSRRADLHDGRSVVIALTAKGRRVADRAYRGRIGVLEAALGEWSDAEIANLVRTLGRLTDDLGRAI
jgi:DNA-binding MarR family transcriptional regulator